MFTSAIPLNRDHATHQKPATSDKLEAAFLEEMLKYCGPKPSEGSFSGGAGEAQFSSFLNQSYAETLARRMDLGIAASVTGNQA